MVGDSEDLARLQRETNDELGRLILELREGQQSQSVRQESGGGSQQDSQRLRDVADALGQTSGTIQQLSDSLGSNASALRSAAEAIASNGQGLAGALAGGLADGGGFGSILRSGFGLAPLASTLVSLFGGSERAAPVFETFTPPASIQLEAARTSDGALAGVVRGSGDEPRAVPSRSGAPQVVVNVSAMDSQSFLNRSHDIARAVREAMLNMDPINDLITEL